jgi:hypothetical protein
MRHKHKLAFLQHVCSDLSHLRSDPRSKAEEMYTLVDGSHLCGGGGHVELDTEGHDERNVDSQTSVEMLDYLPVSSWAAWGSPRGKTSRGVCDEIRSLAHCKASTDDTPMEDRPEEDATYVGEDKHMSLNSAPNSSSAELAQNQANLIGITTDAELACVALSHFKISRDDDNGDPRLGTILYKESSKPPTKKELQRRYYRMEIVTVYPEKPGDPTEVEIVRCLVCAASGHEEDDCPELTVSIIKQHIPEISELYLTRLQCAICGERDQHFTENCPQTQKSRRTPTRIKKAAVSGKRSTEVNPWTGLPYRAYQPEDASRSKGTHARKNAHRKAKGPKAWPKSKSQPLDPQKRRLLSENWRLPPSTSAVNSTPLRNARFPSKHGE